MHVASVFGQIREISEDIVGVANISDSERRELVVVSAINAGALLEEELDEREVPTYTRLH